MAGFLLETPAQDGGWTFQVKVGNDSSPDKIVSEPSQTYTARSRMQIALPHPVTGRYVLLWITRVVPNVGGGNRAAVGLFRVIGPS